MHRVLEAVHLKDYTLIMHRVPTGHASHSVQDQDLGFARRARLIGPPRDG
jgi:hypothetical protein